MEKSRRSDQRDGWYLFKPGDAQRALDAQPENRVLNEPKAHGFASDITLNKWRPNGETIIFDENDLLLDGQGRLRACVISGKPFETYVVFGVPRRFFPTVDTGQVRGGAVILDLAGFPNYVVAAAVVRTAIIAERGLSASDARRVKNWEVSEWVKKNSGKLLSALEDLSLLIHKSPLPPSQLIWIYMEAAQIDAKKALAWAQGVAFGENLSIGSPILVLRNQLARIQGQKHTVKPHEKLAWGIKSWNHFVAGRRDVKLIKWVAKGKGKKNVETFPVILGSVSDPDTAEEQVLALQPRRELPATVSV